MYVYNYKFYFIFGHKMKQQQTHPKFSQPKNPITTPKNPTKILHKEQNNNIKINFK